MLERLYKGFSLLSSVQLLSRFLLFATPWTAAHQASLSFTISQSLLKFMSIESLMPSNHLILCLPLLLLSSVILSIRIFSSESALHISWPTYWRLRFSFSISPSNQYSGLISFGMDWFDFLRVQGTLKSLLQNHSLKDKCHYKIKSFFKERIRKQQFLYTLIISKSNYIIFFKVISQNILSIYAVYPSILSPSVVSNALQPHGLQHIRLPSPSPTPRVYPNSCPLSQ